MKHPSILRSFLFFAPATILAFTLPNEAMGQSPPAFVSDDFSATTLNTTLWTFINPLGDATLTMTGAQALISVPAGTSHDVWATGNLAPRIKQPVNDTDFEVEVKFESPVRQMFQMQGLFVEQDNENFLRFDFYSDGTKTRIFAAVLKDGSLSVKINRAIVDALPLYMRVKREAHQWIQSYSYDGVNWDISGSFTEVLAVTAVGAFVGNSGLEAPAHTGVIDYFFNTASRIEPEDGGRHTVTVNVVGDGKVARNPDQSTYRTGDNVKLTAIPNSSLQFHGWSGSLSGSINPITLTLTKDQIITATFTAGDLPAIDLWYGPRQSFGQLGIPQRWVNILGNVSDYDGVASLKYSLNGGPQLPLTIGPGNPRLVSAGDFNVEMAYKDLISGQNQIILTAIDKLGNTTVKAVTVELSKSSVWPLPYSVEWNTTNTIQELAQIVDGKWTVEANRLRTKAVGYDRLIAIGDTTWKDYEVTVPITIHGFDFRSRRPLVGILMRWDGHRDWGGSKPLEGWWPMGAIGLYQPSDANNNSGTLRIVGDASVDLAPSLNRRLVFGVPYIFKMRVETTPGLGGLYKLKVWQDNIPEPSEWDLVAQEGTTDLSKGSFLLVAHNTDASFGNVTVTPVAKLNINNIQVKRSATWATIGWSTNQPATSNVAYGQTEAYEEGKVSDNTLITEHNLALTGLTPGRLYHFQITSVDRSGNTTSSTGLRFSTLTPSTIVSDEFDSDKLNTAVWKFIDPVGDAKLTMTGKEVAIAVPAGASHDIWNNQNHAPRIMQPANNTDFEIEAKFTSELSKGYQILGVLIEKDGENFLRFDFHHNGSSTRIFAATFNNGLATTKINNSIRGGGPLYMRVKRENDSWTQSYSYDGQNWTTSINFVHALSINAVGAFVGNAGSMAPAHTGWIDYFYNTATPIIDSRPPVISNIKVISRENSATINWATDEPATSHVEYGRDLGYEDGTANDDTLVTQHTIELTGLLAGALYHFQVTSDDVSGNRACSHDATFSTLRVGVETAVEAPARFALHQNYPNPFNPQTTIEFSLPAPGLATLKVFTLRGEEVAVLVAEKLAAGPHKAAWNATGFPSGVYFYRLSVAPSGQTASLTVTKKLVLTK